MSRNGPPGGRGPAPALVAGGWVLAALPFLCWVAAGSADAMNPDGIAYVRLAGYWATGRWALAISGYWGPLLPWLMVPFRLGGLGPLPAGRAAIVVSSLGFVAGGTALLASVGIRRGALAALAGVVALAAITWSVPSITPDLLLGGLLAAALAFLVGERWSDHRSHQLLAGVFLGLAYLAKAVAFPLAFLFTGGLAALRVLAGAAPAGRAARAAVVTLVAFAAVAAPWVIVLSAKYGGFVFSTSGALNHALVGPGAGPPVHPYRCTLYRVEAGRVTAWEDPSGMPYREWSPLDGLAQFRHQVRLSVANYREALDAVAGLDLLRFAPALLLAGLLFHHPFRENLRHQRWRWAGLPAFLLVLIYLPVQASSTRYFWPTLPLALAAGAGMVSWVVGEASSGRPWRGLLVALLVADFALPLAAALPGRLSQARGPETVAARRIADAVRGREEIEAVVGGGHVGMYVAFLLERPWEGDLVAGPWTQEIARKAVRLLSGDRRPRLLVVRGTPAALRFLSGALAEVPIPSPPVVAGSPVRVFVLPGTRPDGPSLTGPSPPGDDSPDGTTAGGGLAEGAPGRDR